MALVCARQSFVFSDEGYEEDLFLKEARAICDEAEVDIIIEEKIKETIKETMERLEDLGIEYKGKVSYRKYCKASDGINAYPEGKEFELKIKYIRDWKMKKIIKKLDGNQFAILCKELGISAEEAISKA